MKTAIVALGGNAFSRKGKISIRQEFRFAEKALESLAHLLGEGYSIAITHGNGPQVGDILVRSEAAKKRVYEIPLHAAVAQSQGELGFVIVRALQNILHRHRIKRHVAALLSHVLVDGNDKAFLQPSKPIGPFYSKARAVELKKKGIKTVFEIGRGYRVVVPSPVPKQILEAETIKQLLEKRVIVVCCGGGGIPLIKNKTSLSGVDAVIDKDFASALLGKTVKAELLAILTATDFVYLNFGQKNQGPIKKMSIGEAKLLLKQNQFEEGSMKPKIEAAINFLKSGGKKVIITSPQKLRSALLGNSGTIIKK